MILQVGPDSSLLVRGAASTILFLHIGAGSIGLMSGTVALASRKGGRLHRTAGNVFLVSMLVMAAIGAAVSPFLPQRSNVVPGLLTFYLVLTSWRTARQPVPGRFEIATLCLALAAGAIGVMYGLQASASGKLDHEPPSTYFVFAGLCGLGALLDLHMLARRGLRGAARIARHVWRSCTALLIAATSLFLGQQQLFPKLLRGSPALFAPELAVMGLMVFWMIRVRFVKRLRT